MTDITWVAIALFMMCILMMAIVVIEVVTFRNKMEMLTRIERLLKINELHATVTSQQKAQTVQAIDAMREEAHTAAKTAVAVATLTAEEVKEKIAEVPAKVIEEVRKETDSKPKTPVFNPNSPNPGMI